MATGTYAPNPRHQFFDSSGNPLASGSLETYAAGTTTPLATYSDVTLLTANPTTITLNSAGVPQVSSTEVALFLTPGLSYKFIVKNSAGSTIFTRDFITAVPPSSVDVDVTGTAGEALSAGEWAYLSNGSGALTPGRWYKTDADTSYSASSAMLVGVAVAAISNGASGTFRVAGKMTGLSGLVAGSDYYLSGTAGAISTTPGTMPRFVGRADSTTTLVLAPNPPDIITGPLLCQGRLTATSGTPVTTGDVSAATSIYFTPFEGNQIDLYDGTRWNRRSFSEITISLSGLTASKPYDVFAYDSSGAVTIETLVWTSATARATNLTTQNGRYVKSGDATRLYLGTFYVNSSGGQTDDTAKKRNIWNCYHRRRRPIAVTEATATWTYTTATIRQANGSTANQAEVTVGLAESVVDLTLLAQVRNTNTGVSVFVGIGHDSTTAKISGSLATIITTYVVDVYHVLTTRAVHQPAVGRHTYAWLEYSAATGTSTWAGQLDPSLQQSGMTGFVEA